MVQSMQRHVLDRAFTAGRVAGAAASGDDLLDGVGQVVARKIAQYRSTTSSSSGKGPVLTVP